MKVTQTHIILLVVVVLAILFITQSREPYQHYDGECSACGIDYEDAGNTWIPQVRFFDPIKRYVKVPNLWN